MPGALTVSPLAGKPAPPEMLVDLAALEHAYYAWRPDPDDPAQRVSFGTSGHRGSSLRGSFNEAHIAAIVQAICDYRQSQHTAGPLFMGRDTHALSGPAQRTALEVLAANHVETIVQSHCGVTPTPVVSRAILAQNRGRTRGLADGIIVTSSHNPPEDGGIKYNPPHGGPAETAATAWIEARANALLRAPAAAVRRLPFERAIVAATTHKQDFILPYVRDLRHVVDIEAIRHARLTLGVDPLGGAAEPYWEAINALHGLDVAVVNPRLDARFAFMTVDRDGAIRMDCSSPHAMAGLVRLRDRYRVAFGNDPDGDRHGIVTPSAGLLNPNHYLAVAVDYLLRHRPRWPPRAAIGKTVVTSSLLDRVVRRHDRALFEVPVGFKWFVPGLHAGTLCFAGEESAGASFLRLDGTVWTTDKDGLVMALLAAEITARTGQDPGQRYPALTAALGEPHYARIDAPATVAQKARLTALSADAVNVTTLAGEPVVATLTRAPGNHAPLGGLKVITTSGWFCARPSGTEDVYKIYAESFKDEHHLTALLAEAQAVVDAALGRQE